MKSLGVFCGMKRKKKKKKKKTIDRAYPGIERINRRLTKKKEKKKKIREKKERDTPHY